MLDTQGLTQFVPWQELARSVPESTIMPVWQCESATHHGLVCRTDDDLPDAKRIVMPLEEMVCGTFLFAPQEISVLRDQLFPPLRKHGHEVRYHI
jgi:hypothetical protein